MSIPNTHIKRVVAHLDLGVFDRGIAHGFTPVAQVIHPHSNAWLHLCRPLSGRGERRFEEGLVVLNQLVSSLSIPLHAEFIRLAWGHTKSWMPDGVIFLVCPLLQSLREFGQRPDRQAFGIGRFGDGAWLLC